MTIKKLPVASVLLGIFASLVMLMPQSIHNMLYFDHAQIASGNYWSLISGHWVHADWEHLAWNVLALVVLAGIIERRSRRLMILSLIGGMLFVDLMLFSPVNSVQIYCGLSGVLNTLLGIVLVCYWKETRSIIIPLVGLFCAAKIAIEVYSGSAIMTNISWPPYALAHLAGFVGTPFVWYLGVKSNKCKFKKSEMNYAPGYR